MPTLDEPIFFSFKRVTKNDQGAKTPVSEGPQLSRQTEPRSQASSGPMEKGLIWGTFVKWSATSGDRCPFDGTKSGGTRVLRNAAGIRRRHSSLPAVRRDAKWQRKPFPPMQSLAGPLGGNPELQKCTTRPYHPAAGGSEMRLRKLRALRTGYLATGGLAMNPTHSVRSVDRRKNRLDRAAARFDLAWSKMTLPEPWEQGW